MMRVAVGLSAGVLLVASAVAQQTGPNGGLISGPANGHQAELVTSPTELTVYILEKGKVHGTDGAKVRLVIMQSGKTKNLELVDQQGKRLVGKLDAPLQTGAIVVLTGKDKHGDGVSGRFVIK